MAEHEDSDDFNPYSPGDAAVDPGESREAPPSDRIADSTPPSGPTLRRWLTNLPVVFRRLLGPVGGAWLVLFGGFVALLIGLGGILVVAMPGEALQDGGAGAGPGVVLAALPAAIVVYGALGILWLGPFRPLRRVAFEGDRGVDSLSEALRLSLHKKWSIVGLALVVTLLYSCLSGCLAGSIGSAIGSADQGVVGALLVPVLTLAALAPIAPALYIVSVTDAGPLESISAGTNLLGTHPRYLIGGYLAVAFVFACGVVGIPLLVFGASFLLLLEPVGWLLAAGLMVIGYGVGVVAYATLFFTLEETVGPITIERSRTEMAKTAFRSMRDRPHP